LPVQKCKTLPLTRHGLLAKVLRIQFVSSRVPSLREFGFFPPIRPGFLKLPFSRSALITTPYPSCGRLQSAVTHSSLRPETTNRHGGNTNENGNDSPRRHIEISTNTNPSSKSTISRRSFLSHVGGVATVAATAGAMKPLAPFLAAKNPWRKPWKSALERLRACGCELQLPRSDCHGRACESYRRPSL